jgi:hypothetical protein
MPLLPHEHTHENLSRGRQVYDHRRIANLNRILADIDLAVATEIEKLKRQDGDNERVRAQIKTLREKHQQCREPFVRRLAELSSDTTG